MKVENIIFLKDFYTEEYKKMKEIEKNIGSSELKTEQAVNGEQTLYREKDDEQVRVHSSYNPSYEAAKIIDQYKEIDDYEHVIFYGTGLGYHIDLVIKHYPNKKIYIYEPMEELFYFYTIRKELPHKNINSICIGKEEENLITFISNTLQRANKKFLIIELPCHKELYKEEYKTFLELFRKMLKNKRSILHTNYSFQKRWILNSMINFKEVLNTPNILLQDRKTFKDKPAILVAAGPSLDDEIENLRMIKDNGLAYIFTVGSAINTLVHHGIYPDAACTYDPQERNYKVFDKVVSKGIAEIPLIFGSSVGYETLQKYLGPKIHMITSQDTVSEFYLKAITDEKIECVVDAPSIAVITLQLLYKLEFGKIILVGQNLAYRNKRHYAGGIAYQIELNEENIQSTIKVKDVYGDDVLTNDGFNRMKGALEFYIQKFSNIYNTEVINTTKGGAHIEGARFAPLKEVIENTLQKREVNSDWASMKNRNYDTQYLTLQVVKMRKAYKTIELDLKDITFVLMKISKLGRNRNFKQIDIMYGKLEKKFKCIKENYFYIVFIAPMNRVYYQLLDEELRNIQYEKSNVTKAEKVVNEFDKFLSQCTKDMREIDHIYLQIEEAIEQYISN